MENYLIHKFNGFMEQTNMEKIDTVWLIQNWEFKYFWKNKIMDDPCPILINSEIDKVLLILDKNFLIPIVGLCKEVKSHESKN